jgi:hypothetical protein
VGGPVTAGRLVPQREPGDEIRVGDEQPAEGDGLGDSRADDGVAGLAAESPGMT